MGGGDMRYRAVGDIRYRVQCRMDIRNDWADGADDSESTLGIGVHSDTFLGGQRVVRVCALWVGEGSGEGSLAVVEEIGVADALVGSFAERTLRRVRGVR